MSHQIARKWENCVATGVQSKILKSEITKIIFSFNAMRNCLLK